MGRVAPQILKGKFHLREKRGNEVDQIIYLRYLVCGRYVEHSTGIKVNADQWDEKEQRVTSSNPNCKRLNAELQTMLNKYDSQIAEYDGHLTHKMLSDMMSGTFVAKEDLPGKVDFINYALEYNKLRYDLNKISYSTYDNGRLYILAFKRYVESITGKGELMIKDLTVDIINQYINYRLTVRKNTKEGINKTLTPLYKAVKYAADNELLNLKVASSIYNNYLDEKDRSYKSSVEDEVIHYLTPTQLKTFTELYHKVKYDRTRDIMDMFMFAFHACGMRVSDVLTLEWSHIDLKHRIINKNIFKTKSAINIPLTDPAIDILNRWKGYKRNSRFVFDLLPEDFNLNDAAALKNARMAKNRTLQQSLRAVGDKIGLSFNLTMHVARHTFAVMSLKNNVDLHLISKLMGHSSITVTEKVYAEFLPSEVNKEVRSKLTFNYSLN